MNPKPAFFLRFVLDKKLESDETTALIKRTWSYSAHTSVEYVERDQDCVPPQGDEICLKVKLYKPYWDAADDASNANWDACIVPGLRNMLAKIATTIRNTNKVRDETATEHKVYSKLTVEFSTGVKFVARLDEGASVAFELMELIESAREMISEGQFGEGRVVAVEFPSEESYVEQYMVALAAAEAEAEAKAAEEAATREAEAQAAAEAAAQAAEEAAAQAAEEPASEPAPDAAEAEGASAEPEEPVEPEPLRVEFAIDYGTWGACYEDGSRAEFTVQ